MLTLKFSISLFNEIDSISFSSISKLLLSYFVLFPFKYKILGKFVNIPIASSLLESDIFKSTNLGKVDKDNPRLLNYFN